MKKLMLILAIAFAAVAANAAATSWKLTGGNVYSADPTVKYSGLVEIYASGGDLASAVMIDSFTMSAGGFANHTFSTTELTPATGYDIYYKIVDTKDSKPVELTSAIVANQVATATGTTTVGFGTQAAYTQQATNWKTTSTPEPTSGMLLLLGMAGLALRRRRA